ncbi:hypothetical protein [Jeotgalicoccus sp. WY2]|nr:hypothetical protein [Jeotgalicoccus sp. WY2]
MPTLKEWKLLGVMFLLLVITLGPAFIYHQSETAPVKDEAYAQANGVE